MSITELEKYYWPICDDQKLRHNVRSGPEGHRCQHLPSSDQPLQAGQAVLQCFWPSDSTQQRRSTAIGQAVDVRGRQSQAAAEMGRRCKPIELGKSQGMAWFATARFRVYIRRMLWVPCIKKSPRVPGSHSSLSFQSCKAASLHRGFSLGS